MPPSAPRAGGRYTDERSPAIAPLARRGPAYGPVMLAGDEPVELKVYGVH
jgi:hypothetical protein